MKWTSKPIKLALPCSTPLTWILQNLIILEWKSCGSIANMAKIDPEMAKENLLEGLKYVVEMIASQK